MCLIFSKFAVGRRRLLFIVSQSEFTSSAVYLVTPATPDARRQTKNASPEDTIQNMGIHGSITGKTMMRIICFDHITTATTPLPNLYRMKRTSHNYKVIYT